MNLLSEGPGGGLVEARYVRRRPDYAIVYLSSQTGCVQTCRFCFLTQSGEGRGVEDVDLDGFIAQADSVLAHYDTQLPAEVLHFNLMARGEALANAHLLADGDALVAALTERARARGLVARIKVSTIMPATMADRELIDVFPTGQPDIYYSLYSVDPGFRRRWLPRALPAAQALDKLVRWQERTRKIPVIHWALIAGENDSVGQIEDICSAVRDSGLRADVNLVRYNPFSPALGHEPDEATIRRVAQQLADGIPGSRVKVVGRVGFDVKASCGMFVPGPRATRHSS